MLVCPRERDLRRRVRSERPAAAVGELGPEHGRSRGAGRQHLLDAVSSCAGKGAQLRVSSAAPRWRGRGVGRRGADPLRREHERHPLKADILNNVDPIPALNGVVRTGGILDICKAMPGCRSRRADEVTRSPPISGTAQVGQTLSTSNGTWDGSRSHLHLPVAALRHQPSNCSATGVVSQTYLVSS